MTGKKGKTMVISLFARKKEANKKTWIEYSTKLKNIRSGELEYFRVKFSPVDIAPKLTDCPMNIICEKGIDCNKGEPDVFTNNDGVEVEIPVLWVTRFDVGDPWVDHSLDDYE